MKNTIVKMTTSITKVMVYAGATMGSLIMNAVAPEVDEIGAIISENYKNY